MNYLDLHFYMVSNEIVWFNEKKEKRNVLINMQTTKVLLFLLSLK